MHIGFGSVLLTGEPEPTLFGEIDGTEDGFFVVVSMVLGFVVALRVTTGYVLAWNPRASLLQGVVLTEPTIDFDFGFCIEQI